MQSNPSTAPKLTKPHGKTQRLTPAGTKRYNRRMRQLCAQQTPGPERVKILNRALGLDWTFAAHFQRAQRCGFSWTSAQRKGRRLTPAEYLPEDQRPACHEDPAWEARNGWADRIVCRECFVILRDGAMDGKDGHLRTIHKWILKEYRQRHPEARIFTFQRVADDSDCGSDVQKLMAEFADQYATPAELAAADKDGKYEDRNDITKYVICRVPRCGLRARSLTKHLRNAHEISGEAVKGYRREHDWAPIHCQEVRAGSSSRNSQRWQALKKAKLAKADEAEQLKLRLQIERGGNDAKITFAVDEIIPQFDRLFSLPEVQKNPRILLQNGWTHPDFSLDMITATAGAVESRTSRENWSKIAAISFIATRNRYERDTVKRSYNRYHAS
jgi:hypothetical protein